MNRILSLLPYQMTHLFFHKYSPTINRYCKMMNNITLSVLYRHTTIQITIYLPLVLPSSSSSPPLLLLHRTINCRINYLC